MKHVIDTSEILGTVEFKGNEWEVCALADAQYDSQARKLRVDLDAFLRLPTAPKETKDRPDWLPLPTSISESVERADASEVARDIFHSWVRKVRASAPSIHSPTF